VYLEIDETILKSVVSSWGFFIFLPIFKMQRQPSPAMKKKKKNLPQGAGAMANAKCF
jgi:hypothetical protein